MNRLKSRWLLIPVAVFALAAVAVGAFAAGTGTSSAHFSAGDGDGFAARVASILGLDETAVSDAMSQAKREMRAEKAQDALDDKVSAGDITQAQADEYLAWLDSAPDWASGHGGRHFAKRANSDRLQDALDRKVSSGDITQAQADEYLAWADSAPDWIEDAIARARQAKTDRLQDALDAKVSDGVITQAQADRYLARAESRRGFPGKGHHRFGHKRGWRF